MATKLKLNSRMKDLPNAKRLHVLFDFCKGTALEYVLANEKWVHRRTWLGSVRNMICYIEAA